MKYTKKPVTIDAIQWTGTNHKEVADFCTNSYFFHTETDNSLTKILYIETLEGSLKAQEGDYIIKGIKGEFYPCKPDIFELTYTKNE
jgi:hypothetical protein